MYFYRIAGALMLTLSGVLGAAAMNTGASKTYAQTEAIIAFMKYARNMIECFSLPAAQIIRRAERGQLIACGFTGESVPESFSELFSLIEIRDEESARITRSFCEGFGRSYREEQIKEMDYYISLLCERSERLAGELPKKKKLNSTLCVSSALAIAILLV